MDRLYKRNKSVNTICINIQALKNIRFCSKLWGTTVENKGWIYRTTLGYCWYDNDEAANNNIYGALYNTAVVCQKGKILGVIPKFYIPNHHEFYEKRWFHTGYKTPHVIMANVIS